MPPLSAPLSRLFARLSGPPRAASEGRAEFNFTTNDGSNFQFYTLVQDSYGSITSDPKPMEDGKWLRTCWRVGIAVTHFINMDHLRKDRLGHWGVYITRNDSEQLKAPFNVPQDIFKIYGINWAPKGRALNLEAIWGDVKEGKRDMKKEEFKTIQKSTETERGAQFGRYEEQNFYFSWPEFVLVAQFVMHEFIFKALSVPLKDRPQQRAMNSHLQESADAYNLQNNNCQDFCRLLINKMSENGWRNPDRCYEAFTLHDLVKEWRSEDNSWACQKDFGQKQLVLSFLNSRTPELDESEQLELMQISSRQAEKLWVHLLGSDRSMTQLGCDESLAVLLSKLNYLPLTIELAAAYIKRTQISISEYLSLLGNTEAKTNDVSEIGWAVFRKFKKYTSILDKSGITASMDAVALVWLTSFENIRETPGLEQVVSFMSCIDPTEIPPPLLRGCYTPTEGAEDPIALLGAYRMLLRQKGGRLSVFCTHGLIHELMRNWVECRDRSAEAATEAMGHIAAVLPCVDTDDDDLYKTYIGHADAALHSGAIVDTKERFDLSFAVGQYKMAEWKKIAKPAYKPDQAIDYLEYACEWGRGHGVGNYRDHIASLRALIQALIARQQENPPVDRIVGLYKEIAEVFINNCPRCDKERLEAQYELAKMYWRHLRFPEAATTLERIVYQETNDLEDRDPLRAESLNQLGEAYARLRQWEDVIKILERVDKIETEFRKPIEPMVFLMAKTNLKTAYMATGEHEKASAIRQEELALAKQIGGW
ncbi:putative kinesin light chain 1 [Rosellinia necatrix]|uniref:Putative kinesin light chain 1 n=1 Tax=Rosellinia necatrix TaxID=77044 RepID=A0A1W2TS11_ROSNE|nr:putative kinesin light chain 1 [Rosellinia necatrix]